MQSILKERECGARFATVFLWKINMVKEVVYGFHGDKGLIAVIL